MSVDAYWYPHYNAPWLMPERAVVTVHDLIQIKFAHLGWNRLKVQAAKQVLRHSILQAKKILTVSETTAGDLREFEPRVAEKIVVLPNGISSEWRPLNLKEKEDFRKRTDLWTYILAVGNKKMHKNFQLLLAVVDLLAQFNPELKLVIIGRREPYWRKAVAGWRAQGGATERLVDLERVSDAELREYYGCAELLLMPSIYEGFGLPPLEAMACGTPVICSNGGALPETVSNAALILDTFDKNQWSAASVKVMTDPGLKQELISRGLAHSSRFSEAEIGQRIVKVFNEVIAGHCSAAVGF